MKRKKCTFKIFDSNVSTSETGTSVAKPPIDWSLCVVCQTDRQEELKTPSRNTKAKKDVGISTISRNLIKFKIYGKVPRNANVDALNAGQGIEANLKENDAKYHKSCFLLCTNSKLAKVEKKMVSENIPPATPTSIFTRQLRGITSTPVVRTRSCLFCSKSGTRKYPLNRVIEGNKLFNIAKNSDDGRVLVPLQQWQSSAGVWYHNNCRTSYIREKEQLSTVATPCRDFYADALSAVVDHINTGKQSSEHYPVFVMTDLAQIYSEKLKQDGIETGTHTSRLREELLKKCPYLEASVTAGRKCLISFKRDMDTSLRNEVSGVSGEEEDLNRAADILRGHIFSHSAGSWADMSTECVSASTPYMLQHFVKRLINGPGTSENEDIAPSVVSQLIFYHAKISRQKGKFRRQGADRETPAPVYLAMKLFGATRSKELVDKVNKLGLCISYKRLKSILTARANRACLRYLEDRVVCPLSLQTRVFTTVAVDNIDHNTSSLTAKGAFHGTVISVTQHGPSGEPRQLEPSPAVSSLEVLGLPSNYSVVPLTFIDCDQAQCPTSSIGSPEVLFANPAREENEWLEACCQNETINTWSGFHSRRSGAVINQSRSAVLPPFHVLAHTVDMMAHAMNIAIETTHLLNPTQDPVLVGDLPLFSLCKQIQWLRPNEMGEDKIFIMMGGMHIEKAAYTVLGDILEGSGWSAALVHAKITTKGRAESMISASHITRTRYAHQVTAVVFHSLKRKAYEDYAGDEPLSFEDWCSLKENTPQFKYCDTVLKLTLAVLQLVRATRTANIAMYIAALCQIAPYFFALDHTHYARWLPVHIRDLLNLKNTHPQLWKEFEAGHFVAAKTSRRFSTIALDQAHEQLNAILKGDGGIVGLTESPSALLKWILFSPEIADIVGKFEEDAFTLEPGSDLHHLDSESARAIFLRDKTALEEYFLENSGNPFAEDGSDLYNFDTHRCVTKEVKDTFLNLEAIGKEQYRKYTEERLVTGAVSIRTPIKHNKLPTFSKNHKASKRQQNEQIKALKEENNLFGRLFVGISNSRPSDLNLFFSHESHEFPPSLFHSDGKMRFPENKCDLLNDCLFPLQISPANCCPNVTAKILDGGYIAHLLKPGLTVTFSEFREKVFLPYIVQESSSVCRMDIVWDRYFGDSLKVMTREKRGEGCRTLVAPGTKIPKNWQEFLRNSENKNDFFELLAESVPACNIACHLYCTSGEAVLTNRPGSDLSFVSPCNHEEADTRVFLHAADAARMGHTKILVRSSDTDVVVLAVACMEMVPGLEELWVHTGTGKTRRYIAIHEISNSLKLKLGPSAPLALPAFHAVTGCDTVSAFHSKAKKTAWKTLTLRPQTVEALVDLAVGNIAGAQTEICHFVMEMYSSRQFASLTECRRLLFGGSCRRAMKSIPPTEDASILHFLRASFQAQVWSQLTVKEQTLPSPADWGYSRGEDGWKPVYRTIPTAEIACKDIIVKCHCKVVCQGNCSCFKTKQKCTDMCTCPCKEQ